MGEGAADPARAEKAPSIGEGAADPARAGTGLSVGEGAADPARARAEKAPSIGEGAADPAEQSEPRVHLDTPGRGPTGDERVDQALRRLDDAQGEDLQAHIDAAEAVQQALQRRLSDAHE